jgi:uncharacterized phage protein (TIGR02218 family)
MKSASTALKTLLLNKQGYVKADLYTFTLPAGGPVLRYSSADIPLTYGGQTFVRGPVIGDRGVKQVRGAQVSTLLIDVSDDGRTTVNGIALITFLKANGLDGANVRVDRVFAPSWADALTGGYIRFAGRFSELQDGGDISVALSIASWTELFDTQMPIEDYQASCLNALFDTHCTLNPASFAAAATAHAGCTQTLVTSSLAVTAGTYNLGTIVFTSGANNGLRRTVKSQDASGNLQLIQPLPAAPANGDTFTAYPGCDLKQGTCSAKFNNLVNFRGQPYIPVPETAF